MLALEKKDVECVCDLKESSKLYIGEKEYLINRRVTHSFYLYVQTQIISWMKSGAA